MNHSHNESKVKQATVNGGTSHWNSVGNISKKIREKYIFLYERRVIFMSIEKFILNVATHYHANLIDIHNALHALGLRSDEQAEEFNKKHVMKLVNMYKRRGYDITKK